MADDPADLDAVTAELYGLIPEEFTAARQARAAAIRASGNRPLSDAVKKLRRPTAGAWLVNQLVRRRAAQLDDLFELGTQLRQAQTDLEGAELRRLSQQRQRTVVSFAAEACALASDLGQPVTEDVRRSVEESLLAAVADPDAADAVRRGCLTATLSYSGLGPVDLTGAVASPSAPASPPEPVATEPVATEPVATEPVGTEPVGTEPVGTEPVATEPVATEPVATEPVATEPVATASATTTEGEGTALPIVDDGRAVKVVDDGAVRHLVLCRPAEYNTITATLRDELDAALDAADNDDAVKVVLVRADGPAFCAGFGLDWSTLPARGDRAWDSVTDVRMIGRFGNTFAKLHSISKPTVAAVQGWCIAGGTDMILNADVIIAGESARFGYPPARVWGVPEAPWVWVARLGLEGAKRYLFTGDELTGRQAADAGMILECVADADLQAHAAELAGRMAMLPLNQLQMMKWMLNDVARHQYQPDTSRLLGLLFDGVARHTQEGLDFAQAAQAVGWRQAVRQRDAPFNDYGERPRPG